VDEREREREREREAWRGVDVLRGSVSPSQRLQQEVAVDCRLFSILREQGRERRRTRT